MHDAEKSFPYFLDHIIAVQHYDTMYMVSDFISIYVCHYFIDLSDHAILHGNNFVLICTGTCLYLCINLLCLKTVNWLFFRIKYIKTLFISGMWSSFQVRFSSPCKLQVRYTPLKDGMWCGFKMSFFCLFSINQKMPGQYSTCNGVTSSKFCFPVSDIHCMLWLRLQTL